MSMLHAEPLVCVMPAHVEFSACTGFWISVCIVTGSVCAGARLCVAARASACSAASAPWCSYCRCFTRCRWICSGCSSQLASTSCRAAVAAEAAWTHEAVVHILPVLLACILQPFAVGVKAAPVFHHRTASVFDLEIPPGRSGPEGSWTMTRIRTMRYLELHGVTIGETLHVRLTIPCRRCRALQFAARHIPEPQHSLLSQRHTV